MLVSTAMRSEAEAAASFAPVPLATTWAPQQQQYPDTPTAIRFDLTASPATSSTAGAGMPARISSTDSLAGYSSHSTKRRRDGNSSSEEEIEAAVSHCYESNSLAPTTEPQQTHSPKKQRGNGYYAPRNASKSSLLACMGSLHTPPPPPTPVVSTTASAKVTATTTTTIGRAAAGQMVPTPMLTMPAMHYNSSNSRVPLRRQLSGSKLESFLGGHDKMEVDPEEMRPRSMSF